MDSGEVQNMLEVSIQLCCERLLVFVSIMQFGEYFFILRWQLVLITAHCSCDDHVITTRRR